MSSMAHDPNQPKEPGAAAGGFPFSPQDALEFMQRMWNPLGIPIPGFAPAATPAAAGPGGMPFPNPAAMFAALDPAEIDRKIAELKIIENWLTMSVNMMQMSIKTMELQKASLEAMRGAPRGDAKEPR
jgi:hypothetical protein